MKNSINGILRIVVALIIIFFLCKSINLIDYKFDHSSLKASAHTTGTYIAVLVFLNFVLYMLINGIRQLKNLNIKYKAMYIIELFFALILLITWIPQIIAVNNHWDFYIITTELFFIITIYYIIVDFRFFFFRKKNED